MKHYTATNTSPSPDSPPPMSTIAQLLQEEVDTLLKTINTQLSKTLSEPDAVLSNDRYKKLSVLVKSAPAPRYSPGFLATLDHAIITKFLKLPSRCYNDYIHGRGVADNVGNAVVSFKLKYLPESLDTTTTASAASAAALPTKQSVTSSFKTLTALLGDTQLENLDAAQAAALSSFVLDSVFGGAAAVQRRIDDELLHHTVDEYVNEYVPNLFTARGHGTINRSFVDRVLYPANKTHLPFRQDLGERDPLMIDYVRGAMDYPVLFAHDVKFRFINSTPPDHVKRELEKLRASADKLKYTDVTSEDVRLEFIMDDELEDHEVAWFRDHKDELVKIVDNEDDSSSAAAAAAALVAKLDSYAASTTPHAVTQTDKDEFRYWITYHKEQRRRDELRMHNVLGREAVKQAHRSTYAMWAEEERIKFAAGGVNADGSVDEEFVKARTRIPEFWDERFIPKKAKDAPKPEFLGYDDEEDLILAREIGIMLKTDDPRTAEEEEADDTEQVIANDAWDGVIHGGEEGLIEHFLGKDFDMEQYRRDVSDDYEVAKEEHIKKKSENPDAHLIEEEYKALLRMQKFQTLPKEKQSEINNYVVKKSKMESDINDLEEEGEKEALLEALRMMLMEDDHFGSR
jgi:hypothetical protein